MSSPTRPPGLPAPKPAGATPTVTAVVARWSRRMASTVLGRILIATVVLKMVAAFLGGAAPGWLRLLDSAGTIVVAVVLGYLLLRSFGSLQRRLLWRVRRKLVVSYILIGFVPFLLTIVFFLFFGALLVFTVSSLLVRISIEDVVDNATILAASTAADLTDASAADGIRAVLERRVQAAADRYPDASITVLPAPSGGGSAAGGSPWLAGAWEHASGPPAFPDWLGEVGSGVVITEAEGSGGVAARAAQRLALGAGAAVVIADLPLSGEVVERIQNASGTVLIEAASADGGAASPDAVAALGPPAGLIETAGGLQLYTFFDRLDWTTGEMGLGTLKYQIRPAVFGSRLVRGLDQNRAAIVLVLLATIGVMFLTIEVVALARGFELARSITGAVHELFTGTERVRRGDLAHRIQVDTRDQLGELARSFNAMTGSISDLLQQAEEKRRLEEELRIARDIQMSLLPDGPASLPGLAVTAVCHPAREVGGDYYDFVDLGPRRLGLLVADVSGKGTSAAFYMAELKGLILSLSRIYQSPKRLLIEVNRILAGSLDNRTFITMIYGVVDLDTRTMTYARAGHTPLIYVPAAPRHARRSQVLAPDGLVVGLQLDGAEQQFEELLDERTMPIAEGDLFALFTDGVTEAMNEEFDLFGEDRFSRLLEDQAHLPLAALHERILGDVAAFVGDADQHDDMTVVLLRVDDLSPVVNDA